MTNYLLREHNEFIFGNREFTTGYYFNFSVNGRDELCRSLHELREDEIYEDRLASEYVVLPAQFCLGEEE